MYRLLLIGVSLVGGLGWNGCREPATASGSPITEEMRRCATGSATTEDENVPNYWPPGTFYEDEERDRYLRGYYGTMLCALGEPALEAPEGERALRWTWLRSFDPSFAVTLTTVGDGARLTWGELRFPDGDESDLIYLRGARELGARDLASVDRLLADLDFWSLPTRGKGGGLDGSMWLVEVVEPGRRHVVERWNAGELEPLGRRLLKIAGLRGQRMY